MYNKIKNILKKIIFSIFYRDKEIYYENFYGSIGFWHLFFWNIFTPGRMILRLKYKRVVFPKKIKNMDNDIHVKVKDLPKWEIIKKAEIKMKKYGAIVLDQYFDEQILLQFESEYKKYFESLSLNPSNFTSRSDVLPLSKTLNSIWLDDTIITIIEKYIKTLPIARVYPDLTSVTPQFDDCSSQKTDYAGVWHVDHASLIQFAVYFNDIPENGSHTEIIPGTHTLPNVCSTGAMSEEYVKKNKLEIAKLFGKRGSVQIHCGNAFHRFKPEKNKNRTWVKFHFCSGNNIQYNPQRMAKLFGRSFELSSLDSRSRSILAGIIPLERPFLGYDLKNQTLQATKDPHYYKTSPTSLFPKKK